MGANMDSKELQRQIAELEAMVVKIEEQARSVPDDRWDAPLHLGEEGWTRRQLLAHVASNDLRQMVRLRLGAGVREPGDFEEFYKQSDVDGWNRHQVQLRRSRSVDALISEMHFNRSGLVALLEKLTTDQRERARINRRGQLMTLAEWFPMLLQHDADHIREVTEE